MKKSYEPRILVCFLDSKSTQADLDALRKIPAYGGEVFVLMTSTLSVVNPLSDQLGNDNDLAKAMIRNYASWKATSINQPEPSNATIEAEARVEKQIEAQMVPTLGPPSPQVIYVYNYDDASGKPNPAGVLAFINDVIFAVETMHQDLAFRTFPQTVGTQKLTMSLPYYQPPATEPTSRRIPFSLRPL